MVTRKGKTGGGGRPWVEFDSPRPPAVKDPYQFWADEPWNVSARCRWWLRQIERGWRPNKYLAREGYDTSAHVMGIYIWEYNNLICKALENGRMGDYTPPEVEGVKEGPQTVIEWVHSELYKHLKEELDREILWGDGGG